MFKNYLKVAFRSLKKNKVYSVINILGLALGLTVTVLVFLFITDETSYEKHWSGYDRVYRMGIKADMMGEHERSSPEHISLPSLSDWFCLPVRRLVGLLLTM